MASRGGGRGGRGKGGDQQGMPHRPRGGAGGGQARGGGRGGFDNNRGSNRGGGGYRGGRGDFGGPSAPITAFVPDYRPVKDTASIAREDALLKQHGKDQAVVLPRRPAYGKQGQEVVLFTNYFALVSQNDLTLFRYAITVKRDGKDSPKGIAKRVIQLLIEDQLREQKVDAVSDLRSTLITRQRLEDEVTIDVLYRAEEQTLPDDDAPTYQVKLEITGTLNMSELLDATTSTSAATHLSRSQELLQAMNLIVGHASRIDPSVVTIGRNSRVTTANDQPRVPLMGGLEALRAFVFSARAATERVLINVQVQNLPFLTVVPLVKLVADFMNNGGAMQALGSFLRLVSVLVTHIKRQGKNGKNIPRYKTLLGLAHPRDGKGLPHPPIVASEGAGPKDVQFWLEDSTPVAGSSENKGSKGKKGKKPAAPAAGRYITVYEFFRTRYNRTIADPSLPVVNVGNSANPSYLPMEVCDVRPGQVARGKITADQTARMIKFAVRQPSANAESITTVGLNLLRLERSDLPAFNLQIQPQLLVVPGRTLPPVQITFAQNNTSVATNARWDLRNRRLLQAAPMNNWACLYINHGNKLWNAQKDLMDCLAFFANGLKTLGIQSNMVPEPENMAVDRANPAPAIYAAIRRIAAKKPSLLLVIVPGTNNTGIYNAVKYSCDVVEGVLCQCVVDSKLVKQQPQYVANVGLKINLKLGGRNHSIPAANFGVITPGNTMFVGLDVTHPSPGSTSTAPSVASIVSSIDETLSQWPAAIRVQEAKKEMITDLTDLFQGQLKLWQSRNKALPNNIVLYRDGVSEGQYQTVLDEELPAIKKACAGLYSPAQTKQNVPGVSIVIVGKRHHTRFYPTKDADADPKTGNPKNGLVVDRGVTNFCNWDFFLQAHMALHGTAKPAHYYVIYDEVIRKSVPANSGLTPADVLEKMTHGMCYLFGRATTAVSICPPAYYADLVCERARCYLSEHFAPTAQGTAADKTTKQGDAAALAAQQVVLNEAIKNKMFYI